MTTSIATLGIQVTSRGVKEAERDLAALERQGGKTENRVRDLGKVMSGALVAGFGAATVLTGKYIANTIAAEKVQTQLAARIKSTGAAAGLALGDLNKMAAALQRATTFDDESIGEAQALLLTFTKVTSENFGKATEAVLDMATAMGGDLKGAALQIGKALNDPVQGLTALSRAGVQFSDSQKEVIKNLVETGRTAEAQKIILRELETQMGGAARAARNTLGGSLQALKNTVDNLLEGDSSTGGMRGLRNSVESLNTTLNDPGVQQGFQTIIGGMVRAGAAAVELVGKLGSAIGALREFHGATSQQSRNVLVNRRNELETELFRAQRRTGQGLGDANDPLGKLFGLGSGKDDKVAKIKAQIAEIDQALARLGRKRDDWIEGRVTRKSGSGRWANVTSDPQAAMPASAVLDTGTGEVRARGIRSVGTAAREAAKSLRDFALEENGVAAALARIDQERFDAMEGWAALRAELEGPLAQAEHEHIERMTEIDRLGRMAGATADEIVAAKARETDAYRQTTDAILEQQRAQANPEAVRLMDDWRSGMAGALTDIVTGAKSAKDALKDFFDDFAAQITRAIANRWMEQLFGSMGTTGQGSSGGGGLFSIFASLFGGGRANGGPVSRGKVYEVNERGTPEVFTAGGRQFLIPPATGRVTPMAESYSQRRPSAVYQTINVQGKVDMRTADQIARQTGSEIGRAMRNG